MDPARNVAETPGADLDLQGRRPRKPPGDPDSSGDDGGRGRRGRYQTPMTMNKWAKPLPKLDLPARIHLQKAGKIKQTWGLSRPCQHGMMFLLPTGTRSTHRVRTAISNGAVQVWPTDLHMRRGNFMGEKHPSQPLQVVTQ